MSAAGRIVRRLLIVGLGFAASTLAASLFAHVVFFLGAGMNNLVHLHEVVGPLWASVPMLMVISGLLGIGPAAFAIGCAEYFGFRSWAYFTLAGAGGGVLALVAAAGVSGTFGAIAAALSGKGLPAGFDPVMASLIVAAGALAGFTYWAVAGRGSGSWRFSAPAPTGS